MTLSSEQRDLHETHVCRDCGAKITIPYAKPSLLAQLDEAEVREKELRAALEGLRTGVDDYVWLAALRDATGKCRKCGVTQELMHSNECPASRLQDARTAAHAALAKGKP